MDESLITTLAKIDLPRLDKLQAEYAAAGNTNGVATVQAAINRRGTNVQTSDLEDCGRLFKQRVVLDEDSGRHAFVYTGDPSAWMKDFQSGATLGRVNRDLFSGANGPGARANAAVLSNIMAAGRAALAQKS